MSYRIVPVLCLVVWAAFAAVDPTRQAVTNEDVINLVKAGFGEAVILHVVESNAQKFDVSEPALATLRKAGVVETLIAAMRNAKRLAPAKHVKLLDPGVYYRRDDAYALVEPEAVEWRGSVTVANPFSRISWWVWQQDRRAC